MLRNSPTQSLGCPHPPKLKIAPSTSSLTNQKEMTRSKFLSFLLTSGAHTLCGTALFPSHPAFYSLSSVTCLTPCLSHLPHPLQTTTHQQDSSKSGPRHQDSNLLSHSYSCLLSLSFLPIQANGHPFIPILLPLHTASAPMLKELQTLSFNSHFHMDATK